MADVLIQNTKLHDIRINVIIKNQLTTLIFPNAKQNPADRNEIIKGEMTVDDAVLKEAMKSKVVQHYFEAGWLAEKRAPIIVDDTPSGKGK